ncbi:hypothetical protein CERSUDRAFT_115995 [Gelatoporia subvermispora B]|uniref:Uncharacterized protein n=1 Tax=Ceriporiopsis subvermispora (strain B) TaxID=914234 RepID=M2PIU2_CERS8|nr:hypothetical protein CERSUDRAFT_115995 [Gelatoporia subvermispora B]
MGFKTIRKGHAIALTHENHFNIKKRDNCQTGGFYLSPTAGQTVPSGSFNITWDTSCMTTTAVDIYLYNPGATPPIIHEWQTVDFAPGSYVADLKPKWWNSTASVNLQLSIVPAGSSLFMVTMPAGPVFSATYTAPTSGPTPADADTSQPDAAIQTVNNVPSSKHGPSRGAVAAAVLLPLLLVIGIGVYFYIRRSRAKGKEARKRYSQAVDRRMSTISTDWKSVSAAGAAAAIRNSIYVGEADGARARASSFSFGAIRPVSTVAVEGGQAGIGAGRGLYSQENVTLDEPDAPPMAQLRPNVRASAYGERISRVSFADAPRPSADRRTRAFHTGHLPPLPTRQDSGDLSPTQTVGPFSLTPEAIAARMSSETVPRPSVDDMVPALSMMRTSMDDDGSVVPPSLPAAAYTPSSAPEEPMSPIGGVMPMPSMPAIAMSPDDMLRAYAERRTLHSAPAVTIPAPSYNATGMRVLYSPSTPPSASTMLPALPTAVVSPELTYPGMPVHDAFTSAALAGPSNFDNAHIGTAE